MTVSVAAAGHHGQIAALTLQFLQKHHIHVDSAVIVLKDSDITALIHEILCVFFYKCGFPGSEETGNQIYFNHDIYYPVLSKKILCSSKYLRTRS